MLRLNSSQLYAAYHQGNLVVLLSQMTPEQKGQWQQAIVQQGLEYVLPMLTTPEEKAVERLIQEWLDAPSDAQTDRLIDYVFETGLLSVVPTPHFTPANQTQRLQVSRPQTLVADRIRNLLLAIASLSLSDAGRDVANLAASTMELSEDIDAYKAAIDAVYNAARRWQLDAAWAILNGQPLPASESSGADDPDDYRAGDLSALIGRMNEAQADRFRLALFEQLLWRIPPAPDLLDDAVREALARCLEAARQWHESPSPAHTQVLQEAVREVEEVVPPASPKGLAALNLLRDLTGFARNHMAQLALKIAHALEVTATADLDTSARTVVELEVSLFYPDDDLDEEQVEELYDEDAGADPADLVAQPGRQQLAWWQVEAAWAVLHDEALPPLQ